MDHVICTDWNWVVFGDSHSNRLFCGLYDWIGDVDFQRLQHLALLLMLSILVSGAFQWAMTLCTNRLAAYTIRDLRCQVFDHLQHVPISYIDGQAKVI